MNDKTEVIGQLKLPVLPLRDVTVFPYMVIPLFVGRKKSIVALDFSTKNANDEKLEQIKQAASSSTKQILLVAQKDANEDNPSTEELYTVGTISNILQLLKLPDGTVKVLVEGIHRGKIVKYHDNQDFYIADVELLNDEPLQEREYEVLLRSLISQFEQYVKLNKKVPTEILSSLSGIDEPSRLVDTIAAHMTLKVEEKQKILELSNIRDRIQQLMSAIETEIDLFQVQKRIQSSVKKQMEKNQREYYLNEQKKAIDKELNELNLDSGSEVDQLLKRAEKAGMPKEAKEKVISEINKMSLMSPMSAEATVSRNYIDWMLTIPWNKKASVSTDIIKAEDVLNSDHYGLEEVKERILEHLSVHKRVKKLNGQVLCLVGPPGVGKTSLGQSIAKATGRKFVRMALGGMRDEAEIRGHRRTYIGAMPGKILQKLSKVGVKNPLFLLDEIDKVAVDYQRGDPASALLEVLDPEQNSAYNDHYLEVDVDLSEVMFVATSNSLNIPAPLLDRMEVIQLSGYTEDEKMNIATKYLIPKQLKNNGLSDGELVFKDSAVLDIIRSYTREAGVRNLEREVSKICRKVVKKHNKLKSATKTTSKTTSAKTVKSQTKAKRKKVADKEKPLSINLTPSRIEEFLGVKKYRFGHIEETNQLGQVVGLAWTEAGGDILTIEAVQMSGKGKVTCTGKLGDVMQESIQAALTVVRSRAKTLGISEDFYEKTEIHIHVPEGATPKDGPSAGIAMCTAMVSILTSIEVRNDIAMTGEITLRGEVLPIGGLKEKLLAARRSGIKEVIIPEENLRNLKEIPDSVYAGLKIHALKWIDEVLELALVRAPDPVSIGSSVSRVKKGRGGAKKVPVSRH